MYKNIFFSKFEIIAGLTVGILFLISAYLSSTYIVFIEEFIHSHAVWSELLYIGSVCLATILAPISATPLIPIATAIWGPFLSALYNIIGWTVGAVFAFWIARKYGFKRVSKSKKLQVLQKYTESIPTKKLFWTIVFMRLVLPVDILSYAIGLFSKIKLRSYILATVLGITPFALLFSYAVLFPWWAQILALIFASTVLFFGYKKIRMNA